MPRSTNAVASRKRRKRVLSQARGFRGGRKNQIRTAYNAVDHAMAMSYRGRKEKKRSYRRLWNIRINAACRQAGLNYSRFICGLNKSGVTLNRKMLADIAVNDPDCFGKLVEQAKSQL